MPRSPQIPEFAEKLSVVLDRLSLSRVQLAKLAGVDKSVSGRWVAGRARPGEQSIVRLTDIVRREIADFSRDEWNLPVGQFAARLGLIRRVAPAMAAGAAVRSEAGSADAAAEAAQRYAGLWLLTHASFTGLRHVYAFLAELRQQQGKFGFEMADSAGYRAHGTAIAGDGKLCLLAEATSHAHWPCYFILNGVSLRCAVVLDGLLVSWGRDTSRAPVALRTIGFRLARHEPDPMAARRRFEAALGVLDLYYDDDRLQRALPCWVADQLLAMARDPSSGALRLPIEHSQAVDDMTLVTSEPEHGPRRRALQILEDLFRDGLTGA